MAQETFGFGVNEITAKGAGKTYEVLAANAAASAQGARADTNQAMNEYRRSISSFNSHFARSQSTTQAARATENQAVAAMNRGRASAHKAGMAARRTEEAASQSIIIGVNALLRTGKNLQAATEKAKLQEGQIAGMQMAGEIMSIQDPHEKQLRIESVIGDLQENPTDAYLQGVSRSVFPLYSGAVQEVDTRRRASHMNSIVSMADDSIFLSGDDYKIDMDEIVKYTKLNNLNMGEVRDTLYSTLSDGASMNIQAAGNTGNMTELIEAEAEWTQVQEANFNNPEFLQTRNAKTALMLSQSNGRMTQSRALAKKQITQGAKKNYEKHLKNTLFYSQGDVERNIANSTTDPATQREKLSKWQNKLTKDIQTATFLNNNPDMREETVMGVGEVMHKELKTAVQKQVTQEMKFYIDKHDISSVQQLMINKPDFVKPAMEYQYDRFMNTGDSDEQKAIAQNFLIFSSSPAGQTALTQSLGADKVGKVMAAGILAETLYDGDIKSARETIWKTDTNPYDTKLDRTYNDNYQQHVLALGADHAVYTTVMNNLKKANPNIAASKQVEIYKNIKESQKQVGGSVWGFEGKYNMRVYTTMAPDMIEAKSDSPEYAYKYMSDMYTTKMGGKAANFRTLPDGRIRMTDDLDSRPFYMNTATAIAKSNLHYENTKEYITNYEKYAGSSTFKLFNRHAGTSGNVITQGDKVANGALYMEKNPSDQYLQQAAWYAEKQDLNKDEYNAMVKMYKKGDVLGQYKDAKEAAKPKNKLQKKVSDLDKEEDDFLNSLIGGN